MTPTTQGPGQSAPYLITVGHVAAVLRGRWRAVALGFGSLLAIGIGASLLMSKQYTATATVLVDTRSPDPISGAMLQGLLSPAYMNTQVDLIKSDTVAKRAVAELRLVDDPVQMARWRKATEGVGAAEPWLAANLGRSLKVEPAKDSNLLEVSFTAPDPEFASRAANAFVQAYLNTAIALRHEPARRHKQFFDANATRLRKELDAAQARLSAFERAKGITADDRQIDVENARLLELSNQLVTAQTQASDTRIRRQEGANNVDLTQDSLNNALIGSLRADLQRTRTRLKEALTTRGENHPQVVEMRESVAELERRINEETRRVSGGVAMSERVSQQRVGDLRAALEQQRARVAMLKSSREEALSLRRDVENAQKAYETVAARGTQMDLESQLDQSNLSVVGWASQPLKPSSPKWALNIAGASVLGLMLGIGLALWRESRDRRIRLEEELMALVQQPLLVTLPRFAVNRQAPAAALALPSPTLKRLPRS